MKIINFILLFLLFQIGAIAESASDSLFNLIQLETNELKLHTLQMKYAWEIKYTDLENAKSLTKNSIAYFEKTKNLDNLGKAYGYYGVYMYIADSIPKAIDYLTKAEAIFLENNNKKLLSRIYNNLGLCYGYLYDNETALDYYQKSLEIKKENPHDYDLSSNLINISSVLYSMGNYEECITINEQALILTLENNNIERTAAIYSNLAACYERISDYHKATKYALLSIEINRDQLNQPYGLILSYSNLGSIYLSQKKLSNAKYYFDLAYNLSLESNTESQLAVALNNLAEVERNLGNYETAKKYTLEAEKICQSILNYEELMVTLNLRHEIEFNQGNYKDALTYYKRYIHLSDSISAENQTKELELAILKNQNTLSQIQQQNQLETQTIMNKKLNSMRFIFIILFAFILLFIGQYLNWLQLPIILQKSLCHIIPILASGGFTMYIYLSTNIPKSVNISGLISILIGLLIISIAIHLVLRKLIDEPRR